MASLNVLFSSVGRRVELLRAFRRAYDELGLRGQIVALDIDPLAPALRVADRPYIVPRLDHPDFVGHLIEICQRERIDLIFPLIDPDIPVLAANRLEIEATGARLAVVPREAVDITTDKWETARFFQRLGLPTPRSWLPEQIDPERADYPLFIKPRFGSAGKDAFPIADARELRFFRDYVPSPIIQEGLSGPEITNDVVCDLAGQVLAVVSRRRIEVRWGEVAKGVTVYDGRITEGCLQVARSLPACGPITVQCMMKGDIPYFTEINARLGGGVPLGIAAGANYPLWLLAQAAGIALEIPPVGSYQQGLYLTRFDDSFFVDQECYEATARHHL